MTIIIGKSSNLSKSLYNFINNCYLVSTLNAIEELNKISFKDKRVNIIFNNFQKSTLLNDISNPKQYIDLAISSTSKILNFIINKQIVINKIIYTSSSSVYGNNVYCKENDLVSPMSLHSALKIANEKLIESFCTQNKINFTICRLFNMYGGDDNFSIISKIIKSIKANNNFILFNNGQAIRDFIHIEDVVFIYSQVLFMKNITILNIGTSQGVSIKNIIDYLAEHNIKLQYQNQRKEELKASIADTTKLELLLKDFTFKDIYNYILEKVKC